MYMYGCLLVFVYCMKKMGGLFYWLSTILAACDKYVYDVII